jgi:hypothetical protein
MAKAAVQAPPPINDVSERRTMDTAPKNGEIIEVRAPNRDWTRVRWVNTRMRDAAKRMWVARSFWTDCRLLGNRSPIEFEPVEWRPTRQGL